jgi:hypothetical protein
MRQKHVKALRRSDPSRPHPGRKRGGDFLVAKHVDGDYSETSARARRRQPKQRGKVK